VFITAPTLTDDEEKTLVSGLAQIVDDGGGSMVANDRLGRRRLAYPIGKFDDGIYTRFLYDSGAGVPKELERRIRNSDKVRLEQDWAADAKVQAVRDAEARAQAEAARAAAPEGAPVAPDIPIDPFDRPRTRPQAAEDDDERDGGWGGSAGTGGRE
jgi:small subunit ribosomal protein S6